MLIPLVILLWQAELIFIHFSDIQKEFLDIQSTDTLMLYIQKEFQISKNNNFWYQK